MVTDMDVLTLVPFHASSFGLCPRDFWVRVPAPRRHTELSQAILASLWETLLQQDSHLTWLQLGPRKTAAGMRELTGIILIWRLRGETIVV